MTGIESLSELMDRVRQFTDQTSVDLYDLLPIEDREAIEWVREHGGLESVKAHWEGCVPASWLEKAKSRYERKRDNLKAHAWELERKCGERRERIRELSGKAAKQSDEIRVMRDVIAETCARLGVEGTGSTVDDAQVIWREISRRLMPEGMEWPKACGAKIRVSDTVRINGFDEEYTVVGFDIDRIGRLRVKCESLGGMSTSYLFPEQITVVARPEPKVPGADGNEIRVGEMVYSTETGVEFTVISIDPASRDVHVRWGYDFEEKTGTIAAELLTHERPDSWERLEEDAALPYTEYCKANDLCAVYMGEDAQEIAKAIDLVRRAKALAGGA